MNGDVAGWVLSRESQALRRVRAAGLAALLALCAAAGWLAWREAALSGLDARTRETLGKQVEAATLLDLKHFALVAYLAKVKNNTLLADLTGRFDLDAPCFIPADLRGLPPDTPCAANWDKALAVIWAAAFGPDAPPVPPELKRDPWGAPYVLNQSEKSCGSFGAWCPSDSLTSAGPDGRPDTPDDIQAPIPQHLGPGRAAKPQ